MHARIFSPVKNAMQSGKRKQSDWIVEFERQKRREIEPLMGYTSSAETQTQVRLEFSTLDQAKAYCTNKGIAYRVDNPQTPRRRKMAYSDNFAFKRSMPWTH